MDELKKWLPELLLDTIVAAVATLLCYILGLEDSWQDASQTFIIAFANWREKYYLVRAATFSANITFGIKIKLIPFNKR